MTERELTQPVALTLPDGRLNPDAVGWARSPLVDTSGIRLGRGRNKRWEYWNVMTPTHIVALTVSSIDYATVDDAWVFDRATEQVWYKNATVIPSKGVELPPSLGDAPALVRAPDLALTITPSPDRQRWRLVGEFPGIRFDIDVRRPERHDCLAVVVPWTKRLFQYTVKDVALPATGTLEIDGREIEIPEGSWAVLDHGRGRWPYSVAWNWGAGSGRLADGRTLGIQVGARWTEGTGSTENGVVVDGVLHKISVELEWDYDLEVSLEPWWIHGGGLNAVFTPFYDKKSATSMLVVSSRTDQCFGVWSGTFDTGAEVIAFDGIEGFAEDVHNRW